MKTCTERARKGHKRARGYTVDLELNTKDRYKEKPRQ